MVTQQQILLFIKEIRETTEYSLIDCKNALIEADGDTSFAKKILDKKYADKYKKLGEDYNEKVVGIFQYADSDFAYCQFAAKSDVVTRSEELKSLMESVFNILSSHVAESADLTFIQNDERFKQQFDEILTFFREPLQLLSAGRKVLTENEVLGTYLNKVYSQNNNIKIASKAAIVILNTSNALDSSKKEDLARLSNMIAMTIVGTAKNMVFYQHEIDPQIIADFRYQKMEEAQQSGKSEAVIVKIVKEQLKKFYAENAICHQSLISSRPFTWLPTNLEEEITVNESIAKTEEYLGTKINVTYYKTFNID